MCCGIKNVVSLGFSFLVRMGNGTESLRPLSEKL